MTPREEAMERLRQNVRSQIEHHRQAQDQIALECLVIVAVFPAAFGLAALLAWLMG